VNTLEALGINIDNIEPGELIASALLLVRVIDEDGGEYVGHYSSDGLGFIEKIGMLRVAERMTLGQINDILDDE
jgi:TRAP-type mannitol/chloroaromatic compound transport system substrate-binding protein